MLSPISKAEAVAKANAKPVRPTGLAGKAALLATVLLALVPCSSLASAQVRAEPVPSPGRSTASTDDGNALALNPANIGFTPGIDARWTWVRPGEHAVASARGHAVSLASPLLFGLGTGFRLDFVRPITPSVDDAVSPPPAEELTTLGNPYTWLTWGLGLGGKTTALGLSIRHLYSSEPGVGGPTTVSLGLSGRYSSRLGLSAVAHDINASPSSDGPGFVDRSYSLAAALRPFGTQSFELGIEGRYYEGFKLPADLDSSESPLRVRNGWLPRATLGLDIPRLGRLRGDIAWSNWEDQQFTATATLDIGLGPTTLTGGAIFGNAIGGKDGAGPLVGVALTSWHEPGPLDGPYALKIRIETTPSSREHVSLLRKLWRMSKDPAIAATVLVVKDEPASSLAHAYEIDDAVRLLRSRGKKVVCHLEDAGRRSLYACASADRIVISPAGGLRILGLRSERMYFADMLKKLGVRAQFVRIGDHKSAPEQLTHSAPTPIAQADSTEYLNQLTTEFVGALAQSRGANNDAIKLAIDASPHTAREAFEHKLVDGYAYDDELEAVVGEVMGVNVPLRDERIPRAPRRFGPQPSVAVVYVEGSIVDGRSSDIPLLGVTTAGSYTIVEALETARTDSSIRAIVLRVDSPGGSAMASDVIWRAVALTARSKPVIVSMAGVAASGGYYIVAPGSKILATPYTLTGSIGIFFGKVDVEELIGRIGVNVDTIKTSPTADAESIFRPFTPEEVEELGRKIKQHYDIFVDRVAKGRRLDPQHIDSVGQGRVWLGRKALEHRLVDEIGGLRQAMDIALAAGRLPDNAPIVELPPPQFSLLNLATSLVSARDQTAITPSSFPLRNHVPREIARVFQAVAPFILYDPFLPLALSDITDIP